MAEKFNNKRKQTVKGRKSYSKGKRHYSDASSAVESSNKSDLVNSYNDYSWYSKYPELFTSAGFPFNFASGKVQQNYVGKTNVDDFEGNVYNSYSGVEPGIMVLNVDFTVGVASDENSPINVAARDFYARVTRGNSRDGKYDNPDLMVAMLAIGQVHVAHAFLQRIYGCSRLTSLTNRYVAKALIEAQGVDYDSVIKNAPTLHFWLDKVANSLVKYALPKDITILSRWKYLMKNYFVDTNSLHPQLYIFTPHFFWKLNEESSEGSQLDAEYIWSRENARLWDVEVLMQKVDNMLIALQQSNDINLMNADIQKAFPQGPFEAATLTPADYYVSPTSDVLMLHQIHNAVSLVNRSPAGYQYAEFEHTVYTDPVRNVIVHEPIYTSEGSVMGYLKPFIDIGSSEPSTEEIVESTRLIPRLINNGGMDYTEGYGYAPRTLVQSCGSELVNSCRIYEYDAQGILRHYDFSSAMQVGDYNAPGGDYESLKIIQAISKFDWHPLVYIFESDHEYTTTYKGILGDISNYTVVPDGAIDKLHYAALMSEVNIP